MGPLASRTLLLWTATALLMAQVGCAAGGARKPRMSEPVRAELGTIGLVSVASRTDVALWTPDGAKAGAREGAKAAVRIATVWTLGFWPIAFYGAGTVGVPLVGAVIGAIRGAAKAPPKEEVRKVEDRLEGLLDAAAIQADFRYHVLPRLRDRRPMGSVLLASEPLAAHGVDTVLELNATRVEVSGPWGTNPLGSLVMSARARLIRSSDGAVLYENGFKYGGGTHAFTEWPVTERVRERLRQELDTAYVNLAEQIVDGLFGPSPSSPLQHREGRS